MKMARRSALLVACGGSVKDGEWPLLSSPRNDALKLAKVLKDPRIGGFDEAEVEVLIDKTDAEVRRTIAHFFSGRRPQDLVLFYFSGHGQLDGRGQLHFIMRDTEKSLLSATSIPASYLRSEMNDCLSKRRVMILDCCYSGAFGRGGLGAKGDDSDRVLIQEQLAVGGYGWFLMTASEALQKAYEGHVLDEKIRNSVFSHFILTGLRTGEADLNDDGVISIDELYDYVYEQMSEVAHKAQQTPSKFSHAQSGRMIIARNPKSDAAGAGSLPPESQPASKPRDVSKLPPPSQLGEVPIWEQLYQMHFIGVWPATPLDDVFERALNAYREIYWINCRSKNWPREKFGLFDHDLAFYMAGWMKDNLRNDALEKLTQTKLAKKITDYILRPGDDKNDPLYSMMVERTYQRYFAQVTEDSTLPYVYQQAGKVYKDISQMNLNTKKWTKTSEFDHELLFYIAGWIKDHIVNKSVRSLTQTELAGRITDKIIAYIEGQSYYSSEAYLNMRAYANEWFTPPDDLRDEDDDD